MSSQRRFQPDESDSAAPGGLDGGSRYVYDDDVVLAVNVALALHRPLLIGGPSGCGKTSLGLDVAYNLRWRYYLDMLSAATRARDLCYATVATQSGRRNGRASVESPDIVPGVLWWAFDPASALTRGRTSGGGDPSQRAGIYPEGSADAPAVVLLDEIDAAPDDVPHGLVEVLNSGGFTVAESGLDVRTRQQPLVIVTTNGTRALPATFTDKCVVLDLSAPSAEKLVRIGSTHFPQAPLSALSEAAEALIEVSQARNTPANVRDYVSLVGTRIERGVQQQRSPAWDAAIRAAAPGARSQSGQARTSGRRPSAQVASLEVAAAPEIAQPAPATEAVRIFISYAHEDAAFARRLYDDLARRGHAPWLDKELLLPGQNWRVAIERAIRESALFLALLSERSVSKTGYIQKEMRQALDVLEEMPPGTVYVVPTRVEDCEPSHSALRDLHWVDLFPSYDDGLKRIMQVIDLVPRQLKVH